MKWKDSEEALGARDEAAGAYEEDYSPLRSRNFDFGARLASLVTQPGLWVILVAVVVLIVVALIFLPTGGDQAALSHLDQRLQQLETKAASLEKQLAAIQDSLAAQNKTEPMLVRLDRLESAFGEQIDALQKQLKQIKSLQSQGTPTGTAQKTSTKKTSKPASHTHVVQKGETLYSIGKQFGLSVSQLRELNKLSKDEAIFPGQRLTVKP